MPHIIVKLWPGRSEQQKNELTDKITKALIDTLGAKESSISVAFEEIPKERWGTEVYKPDIIDKQNTLYKKPGYKPEDI
jgi:4-oxalocrotonate tautomerase